MITIRRPVLLVLLGIGVCLLACSSEKESRDTARHLADASSAVKEPVTLRDSIEEILNEALVRLSYGDKSGLYNLEFEYFTDEKTYDDYLKMGEIQWARMDTIDHLEVEDIEFFGEDSAIVDILYVFDSPSGKPSSTPDRLTVYHHNGRWIKPTVTVIDKQLEYDRIIEEAIKAAEEEN